MLHWLWAGFVFFVGVVGGFWLCSGMVAGKLADLQAEIHALVVEQERWSQERVDIGVRS